jgi:anthranilate phosphoribosyltransferase
MVKFLCRVLVPLCLAVAAPLTAAEPRAEKIPAEAGITKGICSVPNCGDGSLALEIACRSEFLVHAFGREIVSYGNRESPGP